LFLYRTFEREQNKSKASPIRKRPHTLEVREEEPKSGSKGFDYRTGKTLAKPLLSQGKKTGTEGQAERVG